MSGDRHAIIVKPIASEREKNGQCPSCGKSKSEWKRRTDWRCCSWECTEKYWKELVIASGWGDLRNQAIRRDEHRCVKCGGPQPFIVDHIHPIALGGAEWDLNNLQTLCVGCNKEKTAKDQAAIARLRRKEKLTQKGQRFLTPIGGVVPSGDPANEMKTR